MINMSNKALLDKVKKALDQDNTIVTILSKIAEAKGFTTEYMNYLGLTTNDLKKLERNGLALRGYTNNPKTTTLGTVKSGNQVMWVLLGDGNDGSNQVRASEMQEVPIIQTETPST